LRPPFAEVVGDVPRSVCRQPRLIFHLPDPRSARSSSRAPPPISVIELSTRMSVNKFQLPDAGQRELGVGLVLEVDRRGRTPTCIVFGCGAYTVYTIFFSMFQWCSIRNEVIPLYIPKSIRLRHVMRKASICHSSLSAGSNTRVSQPH